MILLCYLMIYVYYVYSLHKHACSSLFERVYDKTVVIANQHTHSNELVQIYNT